MVALIVVAAVVAALLLVLVRAVRIVPQAQAAVVERLGRYRTTLTPGLHLVVPALDRVRRRVDLREQVVSFPPQAVITRDNLMVGIDVVIYYQVTEAFRTTYEIADPVAAIEQLSVTTLRNVLGALALEEALTSRDHINGVLSATLDEATGKWGIKVNRVEIKAIEPPPTIRDAMEQAMRADRGKRAAILTAEGQQQAVVLNAQGQKQAAVLQAEAQRQATVLAAQGDKEAALLRADGEAEAIRRVVRGIKDAGVDPTVLAYQQLQLIPRIAEGEASTVWMVPTDLATSLAGGLASLARLTGAGNEEHDEPVAYDAPSRADGVALLRSPPQTQRH